MQATEAAERDLAGGAALPLPGLQGSTSEPQYESTPQLVAETDKACFLRWLRLLLFQLMLDIIEVSLLRSHIIQIHCKVTAAISVGLGKSTFTFVAMLYLSSLLSIVGLLSHIRPFKNAAMYWCLEIK